MTNRQFLILLGICLIGSLFFALKLIGLCCANYRDFLTVVPARVGAAVSAPGFLRNAASFHVPGSGREALTALPALLFRFIGGKSQIRSFSPWLRR